MKSRAARDNGGDWERYSQAKHEYVHGVLHATMAQVAREPAAGAAVSSHPE